MSSKAIDKFSKEGYSKFYGPRPFKRLIGNEIESSISMKILTGDFKLGYQINVTLKNDKYNLSINK
jgi:ATP-dependent Clp protease ATP-binding subunit ClpA